MSEAAIPSPKTRPIFIVAGVVCVALFGLIFSPIGSFNAPMKPQFACFVNLKKVGQASLLYEEDEGRLPAAENWQARLEPYVKNSDVYRCRAIDEKDPRPVGYAMNLQLAGKPIQGRDLSRTPYYFDVDDLVPNAVATDLLGSVRHEGGANVFFGDGHAQAVKKGRLGDYSLALPPVVEKPATTGHG